MEGGERVRELMAVAAIVVGVCVREREWVG